MKTSEHIDKLAAALAKAQSEMRGAVKDSANPFFKSSYADLESVWDAIRLPLTSNSLSVTQATDYEPEAGICVVTRLLHSSGQWMEGRLPIRPMKDEPQSIGAAITYARRFALSAMVGVIQIDDDGEGAQGRSHTLTNVTKPAPRAVPEPDAGTKPECAHNWMPSKFKNGGEYCSRPGCKAKRPAAS